MVFASPTFLFLFLPVFLAGYYLLPEHRRSGWILAGSWVFYGWWRLDFLVLLVAASLGAGWIGRRIARSPHASARRLWAVLGVGSALSVLGYFKYFNFGVDSVSRLVSVMGGSTVWASRMWEVVLPVGISFFVFQIISYMVDVYRGTAPEARSITDVAAYVSLFPQLVAGPIVRYSEIADQLRHRSHSWEGIAAGARRFTLGIVRKVLVADAVAPLVSAAFTAQAPGFVASWLGVAAYTVQIYFDFSAYSDMAIGLGAMMGFTFPENFRQPYHSRSITEFWRRWHITLSSWLRDYLYIPLGGSRRGTTRTVVNLMTVMVLGGLWHGAAWTFVLWGAWHGTWLVLERLLRISGREGREIGLLGRVYALLVVTVGWVFFRAESFEGAGKMLSGMIGRTGWAIAPDVLWQIQPGAVVALVLGLVWAAGEPRVFREGQARPVLLTILFVGAVGRLLAASYSPFLYFQF
ncbi:MAG: MBOAT family O-acyltransferase [Alkalispirochaeta sp.]